MQRWQPYAQDRAESEAQYSALDSKALPEPSPRGVRDRAWWSGFRGVVGLGAVAATVVLVANIILLACALGRPTSSLGTQILFQGDCGYASSRSTVAHLVINVLSTLLLAASNAAMQSLAAPTREGVDKAHSKGRWVDIGVGSLRNFQYMGRPRQAAWVALLLTSLPLHLLYNSVLIQSTSANQYYAVLVTQDFFDGASIDTTLFQGQFSSQGMAANVTTLRQIQAEASTYENLTVEECLSDYGGFFVSGRSNVLLTTNIATGKAYQSNSSTLLATFFSPAAENISYSFFYQSDPKVSPSDLDSYVFEPYIVNNTLPFPTEVGAQPTQGFELAEITGCRSKVAPATCTIELHATFLAVVLATNVAKLACFAWLLRSSAHASPLVTVGDAIASFLARPDACTGGGKAVSQAFIDDWPIKHQQAVKQRGTLFARDYRPTWQGKRRRWAKAATSAQRFMTTSVCFMFVVGSIGFVVSLDQVVASGTLQQLWANGFGQVYPQNVVGGSTAWTVSANIVAANAPQLLVSMLYVSYNQYWSLICAAREVSALSTGRKGLRVTRPPRRAGASAQRGSHFLSLPVRAAVPLMAVSAALHWALSQSLFLAEIAVADPAGTADAALRINAIGYSFVGALIAMCLGGLMVLALAIGALAGRFPGGMPLVSSCSLAIAAACHGHSCRPGEEHRPLMYGVTRVTGEKTGQVGFSGDEVGPLQDGWWYDGIEKIPTEGRRGYPA